MSDVLNLASEYQYHRIDATGDVDVLRQWAAAHRFGRWEVWISGLRFRCHDLLSFYHTYKNIFLQRIYDFHTESPRPTVIDGGGHIGMFALFAKQKYPGAKMIVFEPDDESYDLLMANLRLNGMDGVEVVKAGLHNYCGEISFASDHSDGSTMFSDAPTSRIPVVKLSDYLTEPVEFLKLNIEGAERVVIEEIRAHLSAVRDMVIEYHGFPELGQPLHEILAMLHEAGFRYLIHDLDAETNPATKPPFYLQPESRFFLWIYAKRLLQPSASRQTAADLNRTEPLSRKFGFDRGTPIDRHYMESFLERCRPAIQGRVLEIADREYTRLHGSIVTESEVLSYEPGPGVTMVGDLASGENVPCSAFDCIILTQTIQMVYDVRAALRHAVDALKPGGTLLVTGSGISQISRYDMDRWGEFWRFTDKSLRSMLAEFVPDACIEVETFGNVATAKAFLDGMASEELPAHVLDACDPDYQVLVAARVTKPLLVSEAPDAVATIPDGPHVLLYHRVADDALDANLLAVSPRFFNDQLRWLTSQCQVLPLREMLSQAASGKLDPQAVAVTFDDGYLDNLTNALPILERYQVPATIFVTSGRIGSEQEFWWDAIERIFLAGHRLPELLPLEDGTSYWEWELVTPEQRWIAHDQIGELLRSKPSEEIDEFIEALLQWAELEPQARPSHRIMTAEQLRQLAASPLIEIGAHTLTHSRLSILDSERQVREMAQSKRELEAMIGKPVRLVSYPFGGGRDFTAETQLLAQQAGFEAAIANVQSGLTLPLETFAVPRRLVRNWSGSVFASWMQSANKDALELATVANRMRIRQR